MAQFIHLADARQMARIGKIGIKRGKHAHGNQRGVFATPVMPNYYLSHQWLRELKRRGIKTISAVQFRIDDATPVAVGRFDQEHLETTAAEAVRIFRKHDHGLGLEVIILSAIPAKAIMRTYTPDQISGWRYYPEAHGRKPCGCDFCCRGEIKNRKLREAYEKGMDAS